MIDDETETADRALAPTLAPSRTAPTSKGSFRHYKEGSVLGSGGMGEIVSASDPEIGRTVAIKRMRDGLSAPALVARFVREARIQGQLEHPAIVPVYELGTDDSGAPVIVMKQLRGTTLAEVLRRGNAPRQRLLRAFIDVCLAIELAHSRGIVHRDLKPANIMLGDFGEVYVLDWGIAHVLGEQDLVAAPLAVEAGGTAVGTVLGTRGYMSPEQERGDDDLDGRADVFALGRVMQEILAGTDAPELSAAATRACSADRGDRFASARELAAIVERVLDGDRDLAQRRALATKLLDEARKALDHDDRREAMRAAGRALALDPTSDDAAGLVAKLMIEPPKVMPLEVAQDLAAIDVRTLAAQRRMSLISGGTMLIIFPAFYAAGIRTASFHLTGLALIIAVIAARWFVVVRGRIQPAVLAAIFVGLCGINIWGAAFMSPLLMLPLSLVVVTRILIQVRLAPGATFVAAMSTALLVTGMLASNVGVAGGNVVIHLSPAHLEPAGVTALIFTLVLLSHVALLGNVRAAVNLERTARASLAVQAWQLRQLVG